MSRQRDAVCKRPVYLDALIIRERQTMSELVTSTAAALFPLQRISSERPGGTCPLRRPSNSRASGTCGGGKKGRPTEILSSGQLTLRSSLTSLVAAATGSTLLSDSTLSLSYSP